MYTSDMKNIYEREVYGGERYIIEENEMSRTALRYLGFTLFCALFGGVYERFSHGVYSYYMIYAFAIPLLLIVLPVMITMHRNKSRKEPDNGFQFWAFGVVTLTIGCLFKGVLDIYGTTNKLIAVYPAAGGVLMAAGMILYFVRKGKQCRR